MKKITNDKWELQGCFHFGYYVIRKEEDNELEKYFGL